MGHRKPTPSAGTSGCRLFLRSSLATRPPPLKRSSTECIPTTSRLCARHLRQSIEGDGHYNAEFRIILRDGSVRWLAGRGRVIRDAVGAAAAHARGQL